MMNRLEALDWCVEHIVEWPDGYTPSIAPEGWEWMRATGSSIILGNITPTTLCGNIIIKSDWGKRLVVSEFIDNFSAESTTIETRHHTMRSII